MHRAGLIAFAALAIAGCKKPATSKATAALAAPADRVYAASGVIRAIDWSATPRVSQNIVIGHPITSIVFSPSGDVAWVGTSAGMFRVDTASGAIRGPLTRHPVRRIEIDQRGARLSILEHAVIVHADGTREPEPFRLVSFDAIGEVEVSREEIGQRIHYAADDGRHHVAVTELGEVRAGVRPEALSAGTPVSLRPLVDGPGPFRMRGDVTIARSGKVYLAIEGQPAHIIVLELAGRDATAIDLGRTLSIRGLALLPDESTLFVNAMKHVLLVDLEKKSVRAALELPAPHIGAALSPDGRTVYLAQTVEAGGGGVTAVSLEPFAIGAHVHLEDISPWAIAAGSR